ncbi:MAG: hypothetical protein SH848_13370 [Saprospiraceae bacterium]|nr:hypothetical protein [Saprospiraceae bacterium]MDZ4704918.1 hypothetical protein [Saprospiraceae bacterium]
MENKLQIVGEDFFTIKDLKEKWKVDEYVAFCHTGNPLKLVKYTDEIEKYQPFVLAFFFAYKEQLNLAQMSKFLRVMLVMWLHFRKKPNVKQKEIKQQQFKDTLLANLEFLETLQKESSQEVCVLLIIENLSNFRSKGLLSVLFDMILNEKYLSRLDKSLSTSILLSIKSMIMCFEEISRPRQGSSE